MLILINLQKPFSREISKWIMQLSLNASIIGVLQICAKSYSNYLIKENAGLTTLSGYFADGDEFHFLAGIIFSFHFKTRKSKSYTF